MAKPPRRPPIARSAAPEPVRSRAIMPKPGDPRQPDLFVHAFIPPMLATLGDRVPAGGRWLYEIKHDGYRLQAHVAAGAVRLYSRNGRDLTSRLPGIVADVAALEVRSAILDGEAVMPSRTGATDFFALHAALAAGSAPHASLVAFDLLELDGENLRGLTLFERRERLVQVVQDFPGVIFSANFGDGEALFRRSCECGLEGIVAKRSDSRYRSGRSEAWVKVKCTTEESFAVIGFEPDGRSGVRSLRLARLVEGALVPCGWAGSGLGAESSRTIRAAIDAGQHVVVDVEHRGLTPAGELRHPVVRGWHSEA